jgi:predicted transcriptional regulator
MARVSWLNDEEHPALDDQVEKLEHFTESLADGVVDAEELATQQENLVAAMKAVEGDLSDEQHAKVTQVLVELTAYNIMHVLHDLAAERARKLFG